MLARCLLGMFLNSDMHIIVSKVRKMHFCPIFLLFYKEVSSYVDSTANSMYNKDRLDGIVKEV
jgi:hypothetical protein